MAVSFRENYRLFQSSEREVIHKYIKWPILQQEKYMLSFVFQRPASAYFLIYYRELPASNSFANKFTQSSRLVQ